MNRAVTKELAAQSVSVHHIIKEISILFSEMLRRKVSHGVKGVRCSLGND